MRPVLLELQGFGAFRDLAVVDFADADFFALVGATGSGKSTVLDAMCFALYGNVPRYDDQRLVGAAMSLGANESRVRFTFEVNGRRYVAARVVRRGAQNKVSTKEARLEHADGTVLAGRESEMRAAVEELIGLSFDDFTRCVVLPQGAFARFLHDKPADRQALLVRLLDLGVYSRVMNRANARATEHQRELDRLAGQLAELTVPDDDTLARLAERGERLAVLRRLLDEAEPRFAELELERERHRVEAEHAERTVASLAGVQPPAWLAEHGVQSAAAAEAAARAAAELESARKRLEDVESAAAGLSEAGPIEQALVAHERIAKGRVVVAERAAALAVATAAADESRRARDEAAHTAATAAGDRAALEHAHRAHTLAVLLVPGEPCPVCEQTVERLPLPTAPAGLDRAISAEATATRALESARVVAEQRGRELATADAQWTSTSHRLEELLAEVEDWPDVEAARVRLAEIRAAHAAVADARLVVKRAAGVADGARRTVAELAERVHGLAAEFHLQRDPLAELAPPSPAVDLVAAWEALASWAHERRPIEAERAQRATAAAEAARAASRELLAGLTEAFVRAEVELPKPPSVGALRSALARASAGVEQRLADAARSAARRAELLEAQRLAADARAVAAELGRQLKTDRFQRWLVEAAFQSLAVRASEILLQLSARQFSLKLGAGGEFAVIDHTSAEEERSVRTLSGGETFQASLALALSLSEQVMDLSGRGSSKALESIFLDEGFGTLDPESLETVAATMETLGHDGRVVGIVTHVRELADRVPIQFRVTKGPRTSIVERVDT